MEENYLTPYSDFGVLNEDNETGLYYFILNIKLLTITFIVLFPNSIL